METIAETKGEQLRKWFVDAISYFRTEFESLSNEERNFISFNVDYSRLCQVEVFWLRSPEVQFIIKTKFDWLQDAQILVKGPFESYEFYEKADEILNDPKWQRKSTSSRVLTEGPEEPLYSEILASGLKTMSDI